MAAYTAMREQFHTKLRGRYEALLAQLTPESARALRDDLVRINLDPAISILG
jgi:hypothetical protein